MTKYIEHGKLIDKLDWDNDIQKWTLYDDDLEAILAADVAPVVHGRWIHNTIDYPQSGWIEHKCSICEHWQVTNQPTCEHLMYCPNCGARMDMEVNDHI